jgi:hypothetical protein
LPSGKSDGTSSKELGLGYAVSFEGLKRRMDKGGKRVLDNEKRGARHS